MENESLKKTKIICTIGPSSLQTEMLEKMYQVGMNCARINTAYGSLDQYRLIVDNVREVADIPIIFDIKGPEIRLRVRQKKSIKNGDVLEVSFNRGEISFNHDFYDRMSIGDDVYIDNKVPTPPTDDEGRKWDDSSETTAASIAWISLQKPVRIAVHASRMIPVN